MRSVILDGEGETKTRKQKENKETNRKPQQEEMKSPQPFFEPFYHGPLLFLNTREVLTTCCLIFWAAYHNTHTGKDIYEDIIFKKLFPYYLT